MVLFLDFDGVLHPLDRARGTFTLVPYFERVMRDYPDVDIVISSSWRESYSIEILQSMFSETFRIRIIDATPILNILGRHIRQKEITTWLRDAGREYEGWIAMDDSDWLFSPDCRNLILTNATIGFDEDVERLLRQALHNYKSS